MMNWQTYAKKYEHELLNSVIPFWQKNCVDKEFGGYFTSLDRNGSVYDTMKYMWMQWRIVYMFSEIYLAGYRDEEFVKIAEQGFDFLYKNGRDDAGRYYFALNRKGEPAMAPYSPPSDCFAAMGCAKLYKITGDKRHADAAVSAMRIYTERVASAHPSLSWDKSMPGKHAYRRLGSCMMLANLGMIMRECLDTDEFDHLMEQACETVLGTFYSERFGLVFENMPKNGTPDLDSCDGRHMNPGHALETAWFLLRYLETVPGSDSTRALVCKIIENTLEFGWDKEFGGIFYFMDVLGKPHIELQHDMKLWWVHCEALLASLYAYRSTKDQKFADWFRKLDDYTWNHFPDPKYGEWFGYCSREGKVTHSLKGGKWKTFFHVPRCLLFSSQLLAEMK